MKSTLRVVLTIAGFVLSSWTVCAQPSSLDARVRDEINLFKGKVFIYAKNLDTGQTYSLNGDERVRTASTIKIAVMIEAFARVAEGKAKWTDELTLTKAARYGGSGILPELGDGLKLTLQDCVRLMMTLSDNTATNMVLDYLSTDAVNARNEFPGIQEHADHATRGRGRRERGRKGRGQQTLWTRRNHTARNG